MRTSLAFTRVQAKVPRIHQSSGEGAFCMWGGLQSAPQRVWICTCEGSFAPQHVVSEGADVGLFEWV